jgi:hypothetical protein
MNRRNILVNVLPGGKSHNFVLKELFDHSLDRGDKYNYHILVHNWDKDAWPIGGVYTIHGYGDIHLYETVFNEALEMARNDPLFGYGKFNKAMVNIYEQFLESKLLEDFKKLNFELLISDVPNFLTKFLKQELNIPYNVYVSPPSLPNLFYNMFEINPSFFPSIGSTFTDNLTFADRFTNSVFMNGMRVLFWIFMGEQSSTFKRYGYEMDSNVFIHNSFVMMQYPYGLFYNLSLPPNIIRLNAITPKPAKPIVEPTINNFLNKYSKNIYFSQGTIVKIFDFEKILDVFINLKNYGFILSFKNIPEKILKRLPENVLLVGWVKQNDLLGDDRLHGFITHGGTNSIDESLYHNKPMIVFGVAVDHITNASAIKTRQVGIVISNIKDLTGKSLTDSIEEILQPEENNIYLKNCKKYGRILREGNNEPRQEYAYWMEYIFKYGYQHLIIPAYGRYNLYELYNYDVMLVWVFIFYLTYYLIKKLFVWIFCSCKAPKKKKLD